MTLQTVAGVPSRQRNALLMALMCSQVQDKKPESKDAGAMPAALTRFVQACFTAAAAADTVDKAAMMVSILFVLTTRYLL